MSLETCRECGREALECTTCGATPAKKVLCDNCAELAEGVIKRSIAEHLFDMIDDAPSPRALKVALKGYAGRLFEEGKLLVGPEQEPRKKET